MSKHCGCPASVPTGDGEGKLPPHPAQQTPAPCSPRRPKVLGGSRAVGPARLWLRQVPALPGGAAPRARGFLSGRRQRHSGGGHGGGLWGAFICRSPTSSSLLAAGRVRDGGVVGARKLSGEAAAGTFTPLRSQPRTAAAVTKLHETRCSCRTASRRTAGPGLLKEGRVEGLGTEPGLTGSHAVLAEARRDAAFAPEQASWSRSGAAARGGARREGGAAWARGRLG